MWEHWRCLDSFQQDAILRCGLLECHGIGTCKMRVRVEGTGAISRNATGQCMVKLCDFFGGAECMCQHDCAWRGQMCSCTDMCRQIDLESEVFVGSSLVDIYVTCRSMEDAISRCDNLDCCTWRMCPCMGMIRKLLNIWNSCVRRFATKWYHFCLSSVSL